MRLLGKNISIYQQLPIRQRTQQTHHRLVAIYTGDQESHPLSIKEQLNQAERNIIKAVLIECGDNRTKAAKQLGIARSTAYRLIKEIEQT